MARRSVLITAVLAVLVFVVAMAALYLIGTGVNGSLTILNDGDVISDAVCASKGLDGQVTVFHSPTCPVCVATLPILEEVQNETGYRFEYIDTRENRTRIYQLGMAPAYIPAVIIKCRVYVGYRTKEQFISLMQ